MILRRQVLKDLGVSNFMCLPYRNMHHSPRQGKIIDAPSGSFNTAENSSETATLPPQRSIYPPIKFRALSQQRSSPFQKKVAVVEPPSACEENGAQSMVSSSLFQHATDTEKGSASSSKVEQDNRNRIEDVDAMPQMAGLNEVQVFLEQVDLQTENLNFERNQKIPFPEHPDALVPQFRRIKKHKKQEILALSPEDDRPQFPRRDIFLQPPPSPTHPWVGEHTPIGEHIVHGDGQINIVGNGEVGFENGESDGAVYDKDQIDARRRWRGLQHHSVINCALPNLNSSVKADVVVKHSFSLTGRGVFATKLIQKGETILITANTSKSVGVKGELERLEEMCIHTLTLGLEDLREGDHAYVDFVHNWVLTGQPSSLMEHWPQESTDRVISAIGGLERLYSLELHPIHIARMAAIMDLNSFLVESSHAQRKGMAYFPEAGFFNHSCVPNASYEILPEHAFEESDYGFDEAKKEEQCINSSFDEGNTNVVPTKDKNIALTPSAQKRAKELLSAITAGEGNELTEIGAPEYLFCCRAEKDIAAGEEILISYIPQEWSFDNRQYVLHDRYRFYCKCPRCSPTIESQYARIPRLLVVLVVFSICLQLLLFRLHNRATNSLDDEGNFKDEESKRLGLFELLEKEQIEEANNYFGSERLPSHIRDDYSRK